MIEVMKSAQDVIALKLTGKLSEAELGELVGRVEASLDTNEKTHMFMEVEDFSGFDIGALARHLPRGAAMLGKLGRFGRIAVVCDQPWIRAWTRIESAMLPGISYELYSADQRDVALAWVEGRRAQPHSPAIKIIETDAPNVIGFEIDGAIGAAEVEGVIDYFEKAMDREQSLNLLARVKHLSGIQPQALCSSDYLKMKLRALHKVQGYAIVGGPAWLRTWVTWLAPLVKTEIRHFGADEEELAWAWLGAEPKSERALAA